MGKKYECSALYNCFMCDAVFLIVIAKVPAKQEMRRRVGRETVEDILERLQTRMFGPDAAARYTLFRCPTCVQLASGERYQDWFESKMEYALSPCSPVAFCTRDDEGGAYMDEDATALLPPLYMNTQPPEVKPRWTLCQGVGPKTLEADRSRSGRVHKPTLRQFGILGKMLSADDDNTPAKDVYKERAMAIDTALSKLAPAEVDVILEPIAEDARPVGDQEKWECFGPVILSQAAT